jgi:hypothetical protein
VRALARLAALLATSVCWTGCELVLAQDQLRTGNMAWFQVDSGDARSLGLVFCEQIINQPSPMDIAPVLVYNAADDVWPDRRHVMFMSPQEPTISVGCKDSDIVASLARHQSKSDFDCGIRSLPSRYFVAYAFLHIEHPVNVPVKGYHPCIAVNILRWPNTAYLNLDPKREYGMISIQNVQISDRVGAVNCQPRSTWILILEQIRFYKLLPKLDSESQEKAENTEEREPKTAFFLSAVELGDGKSAEQNASSDGKPENEKITHYRWYGEFKLVTAALFVGLSIGLFAGAILGIMAEKRR